MGRAKLQIKKIENITNRQVTFSKRRNGLIKKAYELSVLCGVDLALILFSPSGRLSLFSANKSIEDILARYINLPELDRGRPYNLEVLGSMLVKLRKEADQAKLVDSPAGIMSELEKIHKKMINYKSQLEEIEKRLRIYEGDTSKINNLCEAEFREKILEATLKQVCKRKKELEDKAGSSSAMQTSQIQLHATSSSSNALNWFPQRDPQVHQILNFLDSDSLQLPSSRVKYQEVLVPMIQPAAPAFAHGLNLTLDDQVRQDLLSKGNSDNNSGIEFGRLIDVNLFSWKEVYSTGA